MFNLWVVAKQPTGGPKIQTKVSRRTKGNKDGEKTNTDASTYMYPVFLKAINSHTTYYAFTRGAIPCCKKIIISMLRECGITAIGYYELNSNIHL